MELARFKYFVRVITVLFVGFYCESTGQPLKCSTPNSLEGECISIESCPTLKQMSNAEKLSPEDIVFLRRSQCDYSDLIPKVCCAVSNKKLPFHVPNKKPVDLANRFKPGDDGLPGYDECGKQNFENKIFNGEFTAIDEFPWMALLEYKTKRINGHGFACGGALINNQYVLTAAHCVSGQNEQALGGLIGVRLGEHNIETEIDCDEIYPTDCAPPPLDYGIDKKIIHPMYDEDSIDQLHDIAVLKLAGNITFNDFVRPICLSSELPSIVHDPGHLQFVAGWGQTEFGRSSPVKKKLKVPVVDETSCSKKYRAFNIRLGKRQICAGGERDKDSCMGDSGGPLMVQAFSNGTGYLWFMTGVVSIGPTPCASNGIPGVYTKVQDYLPWVMDVIHNKD